MALHTSGPLLGFRIADDRYPLLDGGGAFLVGGRWHSPGRYVIYAGLGFAVALVEMLVRTRTGRVPQGQQFAEIFIPGVVRVEEIGSSDVPGSGSDPTMSPARRTATPGTIAGAVPC